MSLWLFLLALVPPMFYAISNLVDKVVSHGDNEDNNSLAIIVMGTLFDLIVAVPIGVVCFLLTGTLLPGADTFWPLFMNGSIFILASWLFMQSIKVEDSSKVAAIFQTIPAFGIFMGFYGLNENLHWLVILGIIFLMVGGFVLSFTKGRMSLRVLAMMFVACMCYAVNDFVIAKYGREVMLASGDVASLKEALPAIMADLLGKTFFGMIPLLSRRVRASFSLGFKTKFKLVAASSVTYTMGDVSFDIAKILAPLAIVQALCCLQPLFVLIGATGLTIFCKGFPKEDIGTGSLVSKFLGISLMVVGGILLSI